MVTVFGSVSENLPVLGGMCFLPVLALLKSIVKGGTETRCGGAPLESQELEG